MALRIERLLRDALDEMRLHPVRKRIRATLGDTVIVD
jgi:hypothetical protein